MTDKTAKTAKTPKRRKIDVRVSADLDDLITDVAAALGMTKSAIITIGAARLVRELADLTGVIPPKTLEDDA